MARLFLARSIGEGHLADLTPAPGQPRLNEEDVIDVGKQMPDKARPLLWDLLTENSQNIGARYYLGFCCMRKDQVKQAMAEFQNLSDAESVPWPMWIRAKRSVAQPTSGSMYATADESFTTEPYTPAKIAGGIQDFGPKNTAAN